MITQREIYLHKARYRAVASGIEIPKWVPFRLHAEFFDCARVFGEERAASYARKLKREIIAREHDEAAE